MNTTPAVAAGQLRKLADALDLADPAPLSVYIGIGDGDYGGQEADRVAHIDALAELLGLTAEPTTKGGDYWRHEATEDRDGVTLRVGTHIKAPARRCACGVECTHTTT